MAEKRDIKLSSLQTVVPDHHAHEEQLALLEGRVREIESEYESEVQKIEENFGLFAAENLKTYERYEGDFRKVLGMIEEEYEGLFHALDEDFLAHRNQLQVRLDTEDTVFQGILKDFDSLKQQALATYQTMCKDSETAVNKEFEIHQKFVEEKNAEFESLKEEYSLTNNKQYDMLLWTMEKAKNALAQLTNQLNEKAFSDSKFMNASVMQILETLRDTKNKITALFKTTTLGYANKKERIAELSEIRQIPYSEINQNLIDQYVRQIAVVNQKKTGFDALVQEDFLKSSMIIGRKIIDADAKKDRKLTEKYILQYAIVRAKSDYLLKRNQKLSDLLISKYQNEISKIKVDSFRRVEEIKLAYSLPAQFFQNSINLYSNYAFYVSESMDEIDNMLTELIRFNQSITQTFVDYIKSSAKTFEDYKINCLVTLNNVNGKMTELITNINRLGKDIVSLESNNRLEIARVKKEMENADITGDYEKYLAQLENDRLIAEYQHNLNIKKHEALGDGEATLLVVQREVTEKNKQKQIEEATAKHERLLNNLEKDIHDRAYEKELALIQAKRRRDLALIEIEEKRNLEMESYAETCKRSEIGMLFSDHLAAFQANKAAGSEFVVDFVHQAQRLIDLRQDETRREQDFLLSTDHPRSFAYLLEEQRARLIDQLKYRTDQKTEPHRKAVAYFDHALFTTRKNLEERIERLLLSLKHLLVNLTEENAPLQAQSLSLGHFYCYEVLSVVSSTRETIFSLISPEKNAALREKAGKRFDDDFRRIAIVSTRAELGSVMNVKSLLGLRNTLSDFYVEMILRLETFLSHARQILAELEEGLIRGDVLKIARIRKDMDAKRRIIDERFDIEIARAAKRKTPSENSVPAVQEVSREIETILADRVYQLNQTYLEGLDEQQFALRRKERELRRKQKQNRIQKDHLLENARRTSEEQKKLLEDGYRRHLEGFESLKRKNYAENLAANDRIGTTLSAGADARTKALSDLNKSVAVIPKRNEGTIAALEADKEKFLLERRETLNKVLAGLEEQKFVARPAYLTKMAQIRERLPQDYVALYKQIAEAQAAYVKEHANTSLQYSQEYERFLKSQAEYSGILFNDSVVLHPHEKALVINDRIKGKTEEVLADTQKKYAATTEAMRKQAADSEENQKRILNA